MDVPEHILKMRVDETFRKAGQLLFKSRWLVAIVSLLWLSMIAPAATLIALLSGASFHSFWGVSLFILPAVFLLLFVVLRSRNRSLRWLVFQYLGVSAVCFSAALIGVILSLFLSNSAAGSWALVVALLFCGWGIYSAHRIHAVTLNISNQKIGRNLRLVQISDIHIGSRKPAYLQKVLDQVHLHSPDLIVITGDLVDENVSLEDMEPLASISCPVLYCSGNHERYVDYEKVLEVFTTHGVQVLSDQSVELMGLRFIGLEDRQHRQEAIDMLDRLRGSASRSNRIAAIDEGETSPFTVLLYHQPDIWDAAQRHGIELMLSGHTHKGQIWPFGWLVRTRYAHVAGHFQASLSHLFVSQGTGTWGPHMRFGTRCEMTVIDLQSA